MRGIAASPGIAIGKLFLKFKQNNELGEEKIPGVRIESEIQKLELAISRARKQLETIKRDARERIGDKEAEIFQAHLMLLDDPELIPEIKQKIKEQRLPASVAVDRVIEHYASRFADMDNQYMQQREGDIRDVGRRLIDILSRSQDIPGKLEERVIIAARNLTPSDTAQLDPEQVQAFVTEEGSRISHTAIMARSMGIPAVVGLGENTLMNLNSGQQVIVDGSQGQVIIDPEPDVLEEYRRSLKEYREKEPQLKPFKRKRGRTKSGEYIRVKGNAASLAETDSILEQGGEGIGLFRTELIYMNRRQLPPEDEQFEKYRSVVEKMGEKPVVIRTLDIGGDKELSYLNLPEEMNPFLGFRALRLCLARQDIFRPQLKAILRAGAYGQVKIMYPMVTCMEEVQKANKLLIGCKQELEKEGKQYDQNMKVGVMVETPAAVMIADKLAGMVDFLSIGTNDLIQYSMAVDRTNERVAGLNSPYYPAVLRLIDRVIRMAHESEVEVSMCGEVAGNELLVPFLLGAGLDEFSTGPVSILHVKELLSRWSLKQAREVTDRVLQLNTRQGVEDYLTEVKK